MDSPIQLLDENKGQKKANGPLKSPRKLFKQPQKTPPNNVVTSSQMPGRHQVNIDAYFKLDIESIQGPSDQTESIQNLSRSATKFVPPKVISPLLGKGKHQQRPGPPEYDPKRCSKCQQLYDESRMTKNAPNRRITDSCGHSICFACFIRSHTVGTGVCGTCGDCPVCKRTCGGCNQENLNLEESMNVANEDNEERINSNKNNNSKNACNSSMRNTIIDETVLESDEIEPPYEVANNQSYRVNKKETLFLQI